MKLFYLVLSFVIFAVACKQKSSEIPENDNSGNHKVVVNEVLQTSEYTYLNVKEGESDKWLAVPKMEAQVGNTFYYVGGMTMTNFESKEMKRTFESIIFLEKLSTEPITMAVNDKAVDEKHAGKPQIEKQNITLSPIKGGVTIADLYAEKTSFSGKTITVKGIVTKFNAAIMEKNWIHLQDGTEYEGNFDLTVTSDIEVNVGDTIAIEGVIVLDKDFGAGYSYDVIMENATVLR